jgi:Ni/Co efflux regulator RcnB
MRWIRMIAMVAAMTAVSAGCASNAQPAEASDITEPFSGTWAVEWCNEARPDHDCGGFDVTLVQRGRSVCGQYDSARVNLTQVDEGRVEGIATGDTANLRVRSHRNDTVVEVHVRRVGEDLHWKQGDTIERGGNDFVLIANEEILLSRPAIPLRSPERCQQ